MGEINRPVGSFESYDRVSPPPSASLYPMHAVSHRNLPPTVELSPLTLLRNGGEPYSTLRLRLRLRLREEQKRQEWAQLPQQLRNLSIGILEHWNIGTLEHCSALDHLNIYNMNINLNIGTFEHLNIGTLEHWNIGTFERLNI